jgi:hypothetical protein
MSVPARRTVIAVFVGIGLAGRSLSVLEQKSD